MTISLAALWGGVGAALVRSSGYSYAETVDEEWERCLVRLPRMGWVRLLAFALLFVFSSMAAGSPPPNPCGTRADNCTKSVAAAAADELYKYYLAESPGLGPYVEDTPAVPGSEFGSFCVRWTNPSGCYGKFFYRQRTFPAKPENPCGSYGARMNCSRARANSIAQELLYYYQQVSPGLGAYIVEIENSNFCVRWTTPAGCYGAIYYFIPAVVNYEPLKNLGGPACGAPSPDCGNPINVTIGNKHQKEVDLELLGGLEFSRYYNSDSSMRTESVGLNWSTTYSRQVILSGDGLTASVNRPDGRVEKFSKVDDVWRKSSSSSGNLFSITDVSGTLIGWSYFEGPREVESYDTLGRLSKINRPDDGEIQLEYNAGILEGGLGDYLLTSVHNRNGRSLTLSYSPDRKLLQIADDSGIHMSYAYDSSGRLISATDADGFSRTYVYAESSNTSGATYPWLLTGILEGDGVRFATYNYDSSSKAIGTIHSAGANNFVVSYPSSSSASTITANGSIEVRNFAVIDGVQRITSLSEFCSDCEYGRVTSFSYDANARLSSAIDYNGIRTSYSFSGDGNLLSRTEAQETSQERTEDFEWDAMGRKISHSIYSANGDFLVRTSYVRNTDGQIVSESVLSGSESRQRSYAYCTSQDVAAGTCPIVGLLVRADMPGADGIASTTYSYYFDDDPTCAQGVSQCAHRKGDLRMVTNALAQVTEILSYDGAGRPLVVKLPSDVTTTYAYDARGQLKQFSVATASGTIRTIQIDYWPTGLVRQITDGDGVATAFTYDAAHRLTDIADNAGNTLHYTLDNAGNRIKEDVQDAGGTLKRTLSRIYDQLGQLKTQATAMGDPTDFAYDASGNTTSLTDALGRTTQSDYDPLDRLSHTLQDINGIQAETRFAYDALDNITQVTDPKGLATSYGYNGFGELVKLTSPDTEVTTYTYDSAGNRASQTDARGITTTYSYDALNRLTKVDYPTSGLNVSYTYDVSQDVCASGETYAVGRLVKMQDGGAITQYCYNDFGDLVRKVQTTNGKSLVLRYTYTSGGRLQQMTYPDGTVVDYVRNAQGQAVEVGVTPSVGNRQVLLTEASYYPFGPSAGWTYGNGRTLQRVYDQDYRPQAIQDARPGGLEIGFGFDPVGNLTALTPAGNATPDITLDYDPLGRLTAFKDGQTGTLIDGYTYDATGNRLSAQVNGALQAYTYPSDSHRLSAVSGTVRAYDAAGNTTAIGGTARQYVYDATGRMSQAWRSGSVVMNYRYNGRGEQVRRFLGSTNTYMLHDEAGHWLGDYDDNGAPLQQAIWLDDLPVGLLAAGGQSYYIEPDHLGSPRVVIDPERDVAVWAWSLKGEAFGNTSPDQDPDGDGSAFVLDMRFPGQRFDMASGLNQNIFRDYESGSGRYVESDPIGLKGGRSTYAYALGNPTSFTDRLGLITLPQDPSGLPPNWNPDPSHRDPNGERWTNGTDVLDFHRGRPGLPGWRGRDHWHHDEGDKHYAPGEECPTTDDDAPAEDQEFMEKMSKITGLTGTALIMYLIISEGSRLFPPRNLVPVP